MENPKKVFESVSLQHNEGYLEFIVGVLRDCRQGLIDRDTLSKIIFICDKINNSLKAEIDYKKSQYKKNKAEVAKLKNLRKNYSK